LGPWRLSEGPVVAFRRYPAPAPVAASLSVEIGPQTHSLGTSSLPAIRYPSTPRVSEPSMNVVISAHCSNVVISEHCSNVVISEHCSNVVISEHCSHVVISEHCSNVVI
jgi:hypothetical protein